MNKRSQYDFYYTNRVAVFVRIWLYLCDTCILGRISYVWQGLTKGVSMKTPTKEQIRAKDKELEYEVLFIRQCNDYYFVYYQKNYWFNGCCYYRYVSSYFVQPKELEYV